MKKTLLSGGLAAWLLLMATNPAHAYLNPDQCSYLVQGALGGIGGMAVVLRYLWRLVRSRGAGTERQTPD